MRFQLTAVSLACATLLGACGGGGGGASGTRAQSVDFPYPGARYLVTAPTALLATTSSGLAVTFTSNTPSTCTISGNTLVPVMPGECSVTASQAGDGTYAPSSSQQLFKILKHVQAITFVSPGFQAITGTPPALSATSDSGLAVSFASTTPDVCTASGTTLTLVSKGQCAITASQAGNNDYDVAPPKSVGFTVGDAPPPVLTFSSGFKSLNATNEDGKVSFWAGSSIDGWWCSDANWCTSTFDASGSTSVTQRYVIQTNDPAHPYGGGWFGGYAGLDIMAPGVTGFSSTGDTTTGLKVDKQTTFKLTFAQNPEWFSTATSNGVKISLVLGHYVKKANGSNCNIVLTTIFNPTSAAAKTYELELSSFNQVGDSCDLTNVDAMTELHNYTIGQIKFESAQTNTTVLQAGSDPAKPAYPTALTLSGAITIQ